MSKRSNIVKNALRPGYAREMARKVVSRFTERGSRADPGEVLRWCQQHAVDPEAWAQKIDPVLWAEAVAYASDAIAKSEATLAKLGVKLGGGGFYALLYFVTRVLKPEHVVETGVAAGYSSHAFLSALRKNGKGSLHSSDFPYFRLENPEQYIGILVGDELRTGWRLMTAGDRVNIPQIAAQVPRVDLLHYDSDKTYAGREYVLDQLQPVLAEDAVIIFDDIQDNSHFKDWTAQHADPPLVFSYGGKWIGLHTRRPIEGRIGTR